MLQPVHSGLAAEDPFLQLVPCAFAFLVEACSRLDFESIAIQDLFLATDTWQTAGDPFVVEVISLELPCLPRKHWLIFYSSIALLKHCPVRTIAPDHWAFDQACSVVDLAALH